MRHIVAIIGGATVLLCVIKREPLRQLWQDFNELLDELEAEERREEELLLHHSGWD